MASSALARSRWRLSQRRLAKRGQRDSLCGFSERARRGVARFDGDIAHQPGATACESSGSLGEDAPVNSATSA